MESLSERELLFCAYYSRTHSVREAAARAGFRRKPELNGIRLLEKESVRVEIERLEQRLHKIGRASCRERVSSPV